MHHKPKKNNTKHALSNNKKNLKLQVSPGLVASYDSQETEWVYSGTTHTPDPHGGLKKVVSFWKKK